MPPPPFVTIMLGGDLTPREAWNRLRGAIVAAGMATECTPLIGWLRVALVRSATDLGSALVVADPTAPLPDEQLLRHRHTILIHYLPGLDPDLNRATGTTIAAGIGDLVAEQREARRIAAAEKKEKGR